MRIAAGAVVTFDYTLKGDGGELIDRSEKGDPMVYLHGQNQIVPGLEAALEGKSEGDQVQAVLAPKDGYGEKRSREPVRVERQVLPQDIELEVGMALDADDPDGNRVTLWITAIEGDTVVFSPDHPLTGQTLHFDVTITGVRAASEEELSHGHVHGPGGEHE